MTSLFFTARREMVITSDELHLRKPQSSMISGIVLWLGRHWDQSYLSSVAKEQS
jgi:hypothetical protein